MNRQTQDVPQTVQDGGGRVHSWVKSKAPVQEGRGFGKGARVRISVKCCGGRKKTGRREQEADMRNGGF